MTISTQEKETTMARVSKKTRSSKSGRKSSKAGGKRPTRKSSRKSSKVTTQMKQSAMKVLAGAASGAVEALIPQLEDAAGRSAKSAGTSSGRRQTSRE
jgi:hypothetical protein